MTSHNTTYAFGAQNAIAPNPNLHNYLSGFDGYIDSAEGKTSRELYLGALYLGVERQQQLQARVTSLAIGQSAHPLDSSQK